jgi:hypothetical protein
MKGADAMTRSSVLLTSIPVPRPWEAYLLRVSGFPMPEPELTPVKELLRELTAVLAKEHRLSSEVLVQFAQLHLGDGYLRLSAHGREWLPEVGLGVWPDRDPPTLWTVGYFASLRVGETPRPPMYQLLRITTAVEMRNQARDVMLGLGTILQIMTSDDTVTLLKKTKAVLHALIKDPSFTSFPFYIPLFEAASLAKATAGELDSWFCDIPVYIRESGEDNGILLVSRNPIGPLLQGMGCRLEQPQQSEQRIPA